MIYIGDRCTHNALIIFSINTSGVIKDGYDYMPRTIEFYNYQEERVYTYINDNSKTINLPMNNRPVKIYKSTDSLISFRIKDQDRKPMNLNGFDLTANLTKTQDKTSTISKPLLLTDEYNGAAQLSLAEKDIRQLESGLYYLTVTVKDADDIVRPLYSDYNQRVSGTVEILDTELPTLIDSTTLSTFTELGGTGKFFTSVVEGDARKHDKTGLHTFAVYATDFTGKLYAEGTLDLIGNDSSDWFTLDLSLANPYALFTAFSGVDAFNFSGNIAWIRFYYEEDSANTGTIDKILYRH